MPRRRAPVARRVLRSPCGRYPPPGAQTGLLHANQSQMANAPTSSHSHTTPPAATSIRDRPSVPRQQLCWPRGPRRVHCQQRRRPHPNDALLARGRESQAHRLLQQGSSTVVPKAQSASSHCGASKGARSRRASIVAVAIAPTSADRTVDAATPPVAKHPYRQRRWYGLRERAVFHPP
jgi:hypothetical protein